jgi:Na+(H+)/acetate symporter ActP
MRAVALVAHVVASVAHLVAAVAGVALVVHLVALVVHWLFLLGPPDSNATILTQMVGGGMRHSAWAESRPRTDLISAVRRPIAAVGFGVESSHTRLDAGLVALHGLDCSLHR